MPAIRRVLTTAIAVPAVLALAAGQASAHHCVNVSKQNQAAGVQIVIGVNDEPVWISDGLQKRLEQGLVSPDGEGFHGLVGIDITGDEVVDFATYIVGPWDILPEPSIENGADCHGIVDVPTFFACLGG
jgi:hypothetical protein